MSPWARQSLLTTFGIDAIGSVGRLVTGIVTTSGFTALDFAARNQLTAIAGTLEVRGLTALGAVLDHAPQLLLETDSAGATLLSTLHSIATTPFHASLSNEMGIERTISSLLDDLLRPNRVDEAHVWGTTLASVQFELLTERPAEYARLVDGLRGQSGLVHMVGGGTLRLPPWSPEAWASTPSVSRATFQSALAEYLFGSDRGAEGRMTQALTGEQQHAALSQLLGLSFETEHFGSERDASSSFEQLVGWDAPSILNRPVIVDLERGPLRDTVTLERVTAQRVEFRDSTGTRRSVARETMPSWTSVIHLPSGLQRVP
jgi:hypothetical protein